MTEFSAAELDAVEQRLLERLRAVYGGKQWVLAGEVAQGMAGAVPTMLELGATDAMVVAVRSGVGELPDDIKIIISNDGQIGDEASMVERMHDAARELHDLPKWVVDEVDRWDPHRDAHAIVEFTISEGRIAGRPTFGARTEAWMALEDKLAIRRIWEAANIPTAPDRVVALEDHDELLAAHRDLSGRRGTVWAVDNTKGWHGGGVGTHWVSDENRAVELARELANDHMHVRIQPFLDGVACSIHGLVLEHATLAFRPCEMVVLLDDERHRFEYSRSATFWDPAPKHREEMRAATRAVGDALRADVDFRGVFTIDGVLTADGFRPTEVNTRFGAALPPRLPTADGQTLPLYFAHLAAVTGHLDDFDPAALEALIVDRLDTHRSGRCFAFTPEGPEAEQEVTVIGVVRDRAVHDVAIGEVGGPHVEIANARWGTNVGGGLVMVTFTESVPTGPAVAPLLVAVRAVLDAHWSLGLASLTSAID